MRNENMTIDNGDIIMDDSQKSGVFNTYKSYLSYGLTYFSTRYVAITTLFFIFFSESVTNYFIYYNRIKVIFSYFWFFVEHSKIIKLNVHFFDLSSCAHRTL